MMTGKDGISVHEAWINSGAPFLRVPSGKPMMPPGKDGISVHEAWINSGAPFLRVPSGKPMVPPADRIHPNPGQCSNKIRSVAYAKERKNFFKKTFPILQHVSENFPD